MSNTEDKIKVMVAFLNGKRIEWATVGLVNDWTETNCPTWNWTDFTFRVMESEVEEMTLSEIERELGYRVKVVS